MLGFNKNENIEVNEKEEFDDLEYQRIAKKIGRYEVYNPNEKEVEELVAIMVNSINGQKIENGIINYNGEDVIKIYNIITNIKMDINRYNKISKKPSKKFILINLAIQEVIQELYDTIEKTSERMESIESKQKGIALNLISNQKYNNKDELLAKRKQEEERKLAERKAKEEAEIAELQAKIDAIKNRSNVVKEDGE